MSVHDANYKKIKKELGVPEDEPIFILRGKDDLAAAIVARYKNMAAQIEDEDKQPSDEWFSQMESVCRDFNDFRNSHPELMKVPD